MNLAVEKVFAQALAYPAYSAIVAVVYALLQIVVPKFALFVSIAVSPPAWQLSGNKGEEEEGEGEERGGKGGRYEPCHSNIWRF